GGKLLKVGVEVLDRQANLFEIVGTRQTVCRLTDLLDRRQQQSEEHRDDRDDDEQFDQCEAESKPQALAFHRTPPPNQVFLRYSKELAVRSISFRDSFNVLSGPY